MHLFQHRWLYEELWRFLTSHIWSFRKPSLNVCVCVARLNVHVPEDVNANNYLIRLNPVECLIPWINHRSSNNVNIRLPHQVRRCVVQRWSRYCLAYWEVILSLRVFRSMQCVQLLRQGRVRQYEPKCFIDFFWGPEWIIVFWCS